MSFCQSLNKVEPERRFARNGKKRLPIQETDKLTPIFRHHQWGEDGDCKRCFKTRNPAMSRFGHKSRKHRELMEVTDAR